jgi:hybrid cluster-associated redox disulfide protein
MLADMNDNRALHEQGFDNPNLTLEDMFRRWPETTFVFYNHCMRCVGCPIVAFHKVSDACDAYDLDVEVFKEMLRKAAAGSPSPISPDLRSLPSDEDPSP